MKPVKEKELRDFKAKIIEDQKKYIIEAMEFRLRMLEEKERTADLRKKKKSQRFALRLTQHKRFVPYGTHPNFCRAKTSFMLETLAEMGYMIPSQKGSMF